MIDITLFDWLVGSLGSLFAYVLVLLSLGSVAVMSSSLALMMHKRFEAEYSASLAVGAVFQPVAALRKALYAGGAAALLMLLVGIVGVRVGAFFTTGLFIAAASVTAGSVACVAALGAIRGTSALLQGAHDKRQMLLASAKERQRMLEEGRRRYLEGADLREESELAKAGVLKLAQALDRIAVLEKEIGEKLAATASGRREDTPGHIEEMTQLREQLQATLELGRAALGAAEIAVFRLSCYEPVRRLVRRRPVEMVSALGQPHQKPPSDETIAKSIDAIQSYLNEIDGAKALIDALEASELSHVPEDDGREVLSRVRDELQAIETVYRNVLRRAELFALKASARAGILEAASAADSVSEKASGMRVDDQEYGLLVAEAAKAETAMTVVVSNAPITSMEVRALADALARSETALANRDTASLKELVKAMQELS